MNDEQGKFVKLSPQAQMGIFWRILHMITTRYGNYPMGQTLVALTMLFLYERGMPPTLSDLCEATGLPKASVSRYVSWQLREGLCEERVDPDDRRRRLLFQTEKGKLEWDWQMNELDKVFGDASGMHSDFLQEGSAMSPADILEMMKVLTNTTERLRDRAKPVKKN